MPLKKGQVEMVLRAPGRTAPTRRQAGSDTVTRGTAVSTEKGNKPRMDAEKVADQVYRLMQHDLVLESERLTRPAGSKRWHHQ